MNRRRGPGLMPHTFIPDPAGARDWQGNLPCANCNMPAANTKVHTTPDPQLAIDAAELRDRMTGERDDQEYPR